MNHWKVFVGPPARIGARSEERWLLRRKAPKPKANPDQITHGAPPVPVIPSILLTQRPVLLTHYVSIIRFPARFTTFWDTNTSPPARHKLIHSGAN